MFQEPICLVLGNESCDLDSAVSAVSLAYFYQNDTNPKNESSKSCNFLPILNIPKRDYPLKTEVQYLFQKYDITEDLLTFKDELNDDFLNNNQFVLVDHHYSPWTARCIAIYDHRPKDETAIFPENCKVHLNLVGSCATLIADLFLKAKMTNEQEETILSLLRSTIILDTVNFSDSAARATAKDVEICLALEEELNKFDSALPSRNELFESLVKARADISSLTSSQLLRKDLKILNSSKDKNVKIALPGFPLQVQQFIQKSDAEEAVKELANEFNCSVILLMGMYVNPEDNSVHRDFGLININNISLCATIKDKLVKLEEPKLSVEFYYSDFMKGSFYKQYNIKVTRKHILPIVKQILDQ